MRLVDHSKRCTQIYLQIIASCIKLKLPIVILKKIIISEMHHRITYVYINFQQIRVNIDHSKRCTQIYLQIIASCIKLQLPIVILKKMIISEMHHRITYLYINFQQNRVSIDQSKPCTQAICKKS